MNFDSFRAYDIRGVYPTDLDEEAFYRIAQGLHLSLSSQRRWSSAWTRANQDRL